MNEINQPSDAAARHEAIDISDFVYGATGTRIRRLTMPDGGHWFPVVDVCRQLGYVTPRKALVDHVPEEHRDILETVTGSHSLSVPAGREWRRDLQIIDLQGLISLVNGCTKPACGPFKKWVTEVIATVQREGSYTLPRAEVQPADPATPVAYAIPQDVADAIIRLEQRNIRADELFASVQRESLAAHRATARAMERIADRLDTLLTDRPGPVAVDRPARPARPTAEAVLADWKSRMSVTEDVWAVAVTTAPILAADGELRQSLESLATRTGLSVHRVNECLRFIRKHACITARGGTESGEPVYVLNR